MRKARHPTAQPTGLYRHSHAARWLCACVITGCVFLPSRRDLFFSPGGRVQIVLPRLACDTHDGTMRLTTWLYEDTPSRMASTRSPRIVARPSLLPRGDAGPARAPPRVAAPGRLFASVLSAFCICRERVSAASSTAARVGASAPPATRRALRSSNACALPTRGAGT